MTYGEAERQLNKRQQTEIYPHNLPPLQTCSVQLHAGIPCKLYHSGQCRKPAETVNMQLLWAARARKLLSHAQTPCEETAQSPV